MPKKRHKIELYTIPEPQWYMVRLFCKNPGDPRHALDIARALKRFGGKGSMIYYAYYDGPDAPRVYPGVIGRIELSFCPGNQKLRGDDIRKRATKFKMARTSVSKREGPGSVEHALAFDFVCQLVDAEVSIEKWEDIRHWIHNMLGFSYTLEMASYAATIWRFTCYTPPHSRMELHSELFKEKQATSGGDYVAGN